MLTQQTFRPKLDDNNTEQILLPKKQQPQNKNKTLSIYLSLLPPRLAVVVFSLQHFPCPHPYTKFTQRSNKPLTCARPFDQLQLSMMFSFSLKDLKKKRTSSAVYSLFYSLLRSTVCLGGEPSAKHPCTILSQPR